MANAALGPYRGLGVGVDISSGFRFVTSDLGQIHGHLMAYRKVVSGLVRDETCRFAARHAAQRIDKAATKGEPCDSPLSGCMFKLWERQKEIRASGYRDVEVDFDFNVAVLPYEGRVYGIVYSEREAWRRGFFGQPWVEDYAYWNGGDRPDAIGKEEWAARGDLWSRLMAQDEAGRPVGCGFTVEMSVPKFWPDVADVFAQLPDRESRVLEHARVQALELAVKPLYAREKAEGRTPDPLALCFEADSALRTPEGAAQVSAQADLLRGVLPVITLDMLRGQ